jgi:hypothetical protein
MNKGMKNLFTVLPGIVSSLYGKFQKSQNCMLSREILMSSGTKKYAHSSLYHHIANWLILLCLVFSAVLATPNTLSIAEQKTTGNLNSYRSCCIECGWYLSTNSHTFQFSYISSLLRTLNVNFSPP